MQIRTNKFVLLETRAWIQICKADGHRTGGLEGELRECWERNEKELRGNWENPEKIRGRLREDRRGTETKRSRGKTERWKRRLKIKIWFELINFDNFHAENLLSQ